MREARGWSQERLAAQVGMPQTAISRLESSSYGKPTITTLKRMARVYDVALEVRFVPFSKLLNRISGTPYVESGLSSDAIDVPSFDEEENQGAFLDAPLPDRYESEQRQVIERTVPPQAGGIPNITTGTIANIGQAQWRPLVKLHGTVTVENYAALEKKEPSSEHNTFGIKGGLADAARFGATG
jgi:transcriptional regulator with XRE-family HTH domain